MHYIISPYIPSHHITSYCITSHHITSHYITLHHITSHHITLHHIISHHITLHCMALYHITSHYITLHHITIHHYKASITAHGLPESSSLRGSILGTRAAEHRGCNWACKMTDGCSLKAVGCSATLFWHMPQK